MRKSMLVCLIALAAIQVFAAGIGLKPGLWETRVIKQVVDGRDTAGQMQQAMANMTPEQRARMEAMMKGSGGPTANGSYRMCISAEMASRDKPMIDREGCEPATVNHSGNHTTYEFSCTRNGNVMSGKGESTANGDTISTVVDTTVHKATGETHVMHMESEMKFLGADCGDVKPMTPPTPPTPPTTPTTPKTAP